MLAVAAVVVLCCTALATLGAAQQARASARTAADLGALAGASAARWGLEPCPTAQRAVERNGARLVACEAGDGGVVTVTVARALTGTVGHPPAVGDAEATARAGPAGVRE